MPSGPVTVCCARSTVDARAQIGVQLPRRSADLGAHAHRNRPFFRQLLVKMSPSSRQIERHPESVQRIDGPSREEPQPKLRSATMMRPAE